MCYYRPALEEKEDKIKIVNSQAGDNGNDREFLSFYIGTTPSNRN